MHIIRNKVPFPVSNVASVDLVADRLTLQKKRWRGVAEDSAEFGFDLHEPLRHGDVFFATNEIAYVLRQTPEPILEVEATVSAKQWALLAWSIGNLHQPIDVQPGRLRTLDDPAVRALLDDLHVAYAVIDAVFQPQGGAVHHHAHAGHR